MECGIHDKGKNCLIDDSQDLLQIAVVELLVLTK